MLCLRLQNKSSGADARFVSLSQDRADRAARYAKNQGEVEAARLAALQARQAEQEAKKDASARERR